MIRTNRWLVTVKLNGPHASCRASIVGVYNSARSFVPPDPPPFRSLMLTGDCWKDVYGQVCRLVRPDDPRPVSGWSNLKQAMKRPKTVA